MMQPRSALQPIHFSFLKKNLARILCDPLAREPPLFLGVSGGHLLCRLAYAKGGLFCGLT